MSARPCKIIFVVAATGAVLALGKKLLSDRREPTH